MGLELVAKVVSESNELRGFRLSNIAGRTYDITSEQLIDMAKSNRIDNAYFDLVLNKVRLKPHSSKIYTVTDELKLSNVVQDDADSIKKWVDKYLLKAKAFEDMDLHEMYLALLRKFKGADSILTWDSADEAICYIDYETALRHKEYSYAVNSWAKLFSGIELDIIDLRGYDFSRVESFEYTFGSSKIGKIMFDDYLDTPYLEMANQMFYALDIEELVFPKMNLKRLAYAREMFTYCSAKHIDVSNMTETYILSQAYGMFSNLHVDTIDISRLYTSYIQDAQGMFSNSIIGTLIIGEHNLEGLVYAREMFMGAVIGTVDFSKCTFDIIGEASSMFEGFRGDIVDLGPFGGEHLNTVNSIFKAANIHRLNLSRINWSCVSDFGEAFESSTIPRVDLSNMRLIDDVYCVKSFANSHIKHLNLTGFKCLPKRESALFDKCYDRMELTCDNEAVQYMFHVRRKNPPIVHNKKHKGKVN